MNAARSCWCILIEGLLFCVVQNRLCTTMYNDSAPAQTNNNRLTYGVWSNHVIYALITTKLDYYYSTSNAEFFTLALSYGEIFYCILQIALHQATDRTEPVFGATQIIHYGFSIFIRRMPPQINGNSQNEFPICTDYVIESQCRYFLLALCHMF